ncbi:MAG: hypothetical protein RBU23_10710 [Candidatus Auribacterota bacterium]|jgi:hypothetical protein|nr:hypothetical protein [Candidatus Auribacterota bacterium]
MQAKNVLKKCLLIVFALAYMVVSSGCAFLVAGAAAGAYIHGKNIEKAEGSE